jgi:hypothetical protein
LTSAGRRGWRRGVGRPVEDDEPFLALLADPGGYVFIDEALDRAERPVQGVESERVLEACAGREQPSDGGTRVTALERRDEFREAEISARVVARFGRTAWRKQAIAIYDSLVEAHG